VTGVVAACVVTGSGLAVIVVLALAGWIAAPHASIGMPAVLRTAAGIWLVGQHVGFTLHGAGRIGLLPLGLVALPGALLWRAGRRVVRACQVRQLRQAGIAALALAVPYSALTAALALVSRSAQFAASVPQAAVCGLLLALAAGGLGAARELAGWRELMRLLPERPRSVVIAVAGSAAVLAAAGALLAGAALAVHLREAATLQRSLGAGSVGTILLMLLQLGYVPNAVLWAIAFTFGPGFAFGSATVVAPTGAALGQLPAVPMLAALPPGVHPALPGWLAPMVLTLPYLAGAVGGWLLIRTTPALSLEAAPLWGMASGVLTGCLLGVLAAFSGGPLGDGRLTAVGPSGWQVAATGALELGLAAAVTAGLANFLVLRRAEGLRPGVLRRERPAAPADRSGRDAGTEVGGRGRVAPTDHVIYLDPWAGERPAGKAARPRGPSALP